MAKSKLIKEVKDIESDLDGLDTCIDLAEAWCDGEIHVGIVDLLYLAFKHGIKFERDNLEQ